MSWSFVKLDSLVELITKGTTPTSVGYEFVDSGINFIKIESLDGAGNFLPEKFAKINADCHKALKRSQLIEGDILFSIAGALGRAGVVTKSILPANTNQALAIIRLKPDALIIKQFLLYFFKSEGILRQVSQMKGGVAQQNLSLSQLKEFLIPLPPLTTQQKIVEKLDAIFAQIDKASASAEANIQNAEALFLSYLSEIFERDKDDWSLTKLGDYYDVRDGTHDSPRYVDDGFPLITSKNLKNGEIDFQKIQYISEEDYLSISQRSAVRKGDVLMAMIGTIGNPVVIESEDKFAIKNVALFKTNNSQSPHFLKYYLSSSSTIKKMEMDAKGASQKFIGLGYLRSFPIRIPSFQKQLEIVSKIKEFEATTKKLTFASSSKVNQLITLKKSILKQAFKGELLRE